MNWLQELCTAEEYCIKCKTSYPGGYHHSCGKAPIKPKRFTGSSLKVIDAATGQPPKPPMRIYDCDGNELQFIRWDEKTQKNIFKIKKKATSSKKRKTKAADYFAAQEFGVEL